MQKPNGIYNVKIRTIINKLLSLFIDAIEQVNVISISIWDASSVPNILIFYFFQVKEQCEFRAPLEDKIPVMICSSALKSPISTRLTSSVQMILIKVPGEITKALHVCHVCKDYVLSGHLCYMPTEPLKKPYNKLIFYDFETDIRTSHG